MTATRSLRALMLALLLGGVATACVKGADELPDVVGPDAPTTSEVITGDLPVTADVTPPECIGFLDEDWSQPDGWNYRLPNDSMVPLAPQSGALLLESGDELWREGFSLLPDAGKFTARLRRTGSEVDVYSQFQFEAGGDWGLSFWVDTAGLLTVRLFSSNTSAGYIDTEDVLIPTADKPFDVEVFYNGTDTLLKVTTAGENVSTEVLSGFSPIASTNLRLYGGFDLEIERLTINRCASSETPACDSQTCSGECTVCDPLVGCLNTNEGLSCALPDGCSTTATCSGGSCTCF